MDFDLQSGDSAAGLFAPLTARMKWRKPIVSLCLDPGRRKGGSWIGWRDKASLIPQGSSLAMAASSRRTPSYQASSPFTKRSTPMA